MRFKIWQGAVILGGIATSSVAAQSFEHDGQMLSLWERVWLALQFSVEGALGLVGIIELWLLVGIPALIWLIAVLAHRYMGDRMSSDVSRLVKWVHRGAIVGTGLAVLILILIVVNEVGFYWRGILFDR